MRPEIAPEDRNLASARMLIDLVNNTLDPGYAAAARRRGAARARSRWDAALTAAGCLLVGLVLVVAYVHTHRSAPAAAKVHDRLVARVRSAQHVADDLNTRLRDVQRALAEAQASALPESGALARPLISEQLAAGQVAVSGPGVTVTLSEPPAASASASTARAGTTPLKSTNILTDRDVRSVVNELWHDGAEAIAVNDVRLAPTSAIRFAGAAVLVDFQPITPPYRISAIGDANALSTNFAESAVASRYQTLKGVDGIGFDIAESGSLHVPAGAAVQPRYARVPRGTR